MVQFQFQLKQSLLYSRKLNEVRATTIGCDYDNLVSASAGMLL